MLRMMRCDLILGSNFGGCSGTSCAKSGLSRAWWPGPNYGVLRLPWAQKPLEMSQLLFSLGVPSRSSSNGRRKQGPQQTDNASKTSCENPTLCSSRGVETRNNGLRFLKLMMEEAVGAGGGSQRGLEVTEGFKRKP